MKPIFTKDDFPGFEKPLSPEHKLHCAIMANEKLEKMGIDADTPNLIGKLRGELRELKSEAKRIVKKLEQDNNALRTELTKAREALALIEDKMPGWSCMDTPGLAKDALRSIDESGLLK